MQTTKTNILIIISFIVTVISFIYPDIFIFGMNKYLINSGKFYGLLIQFILYSFIHGGLLHLISNSLFLYYFGNQIESLISKKNYIIFFVFSTIFTGISLLLLTNSNTVGISGFALAVLAFYTMKLYEVGNPEYKGGITAIIVNIIIGFGTNISLVGHLFGAISGVIFYFIIKDKYKTVIYAE